MPVAVQSSTSGSGLVASKPSGVVSGDLLIVQISHRDTVTAVHTAPDGSWTQIGSTQDNGQSGLSLWWKIAGGSEPSTYTWTVDDPATSSGYSMLRMDGHDPTTPINTQSLTTDNGTTLTCPTVTTTVNDCLLLRTATQLAGTTGDPRTEPSGTTPVTNRTVGGSGGHWQGVASIAQASAGASGTADWTSNDSGNGCVATVAIAPAAAGGDANPQCWGQYRRRRAA